MLSVSIVFILLIYTLNSTTAGPLFGDQINVQFETKYDNNHNELKQLFSDQKKFNSDNWTHFALVWQSFVASMVFLIILVYAYRRCGPALQLACRTPQSSPQVPFINKSLPTIVQPPYNYGPPPSCQLPMETYSSLLTKPNRETVTALQLTPSQLVS